MGLYPTRHRKVFSGDQLLTTKVWGFGFRVGAMELLLGTLLNLAKARLQGGQRWV